MKKLILIIFTIFYCWNSINTFAMEANNNNNNKNSSNNNYGKFPRDIWSEIISYFINDFIAADSLPKLKNALINLQVFMRLNKSCRSLVYVLLTKKLNLTEDQLRDLYINKRKAIFGSLVEKFRAATEIYVSHFYNNDINEKNLDGKTALMNAAICGNIELVNSLILNGANLNLKDQYSQDALCYAKGSLQACRFSLNNNNHNVEGINSMEKKIKDLEKVVELLEKIIKEQQFNDTYIDGNYYRSHDCVIS